MSVSKIWNPWPQDGNTECHAGSQWTPITNSREDRYVIHIALMDCAISLRALSQKLGTFARQQVSARTVRRRLL
ncbi:HTH_Tnp_Tc3_2 domain-containing protein [Trichonephila clavipes]|nr:HTH_Tnp_Tc3_2 domain-containing protein [Trichonephila clavipes]